MTVSHKNDRDTCLPDDWDRSGLPAWSYHSETLLELEKEQLFKTHWQIACHVSDIPNPGDYISFDLLTERAIIVRDEQDEIRAFHNICRHRGSRVVVDEKGHCPNALVCPFHGWVYNLDGSLRGPAKPRSFPKLDKQAFGLKPVELEVWQGFVFLRFSPGPQPSVDELMRPFSQEMAAYKMAEHIPAEPMWNEHVPVNWKSVRDVDNEGYHVAMAHPALQELYGNNYIDEPYIAGISRSRGEFNSAGGRRWAVRHYLNISKPREDLPEHLHRSWLYYGMFPNAVIAVTPETVLFYQEVPLSAKKTLMRGKVYRHPHEDRQQRLARYLAHRIDRETVAEDIQLTIWSNEAMESKSFEGFYLSDLEFGVRTYHDHLRRILPIYNREQEPAKAEIVAMNTSTV